MTTESTVEELGPVDYLVIEFPAGQQNFTGEAADELAKLAASGTIRMLDVLIIVKNEDGSVDAMEIDDTPAVDAIRALEADIAEILAAEDVELLAEAMEPGSVAGVLVFENRWAAPFAVPPAAPVGSSSPTGRIPIQAIAASIEAELASEEGN